MHRQTHMRMGAHASDTWLTPPAREFGFRQVIDQIEGALSPNDLCALRNALARLQDQARELESENSALRRLAMTDSLTGALNRRAFLSISDTLREACSEKRQPVSCMMIDVDHFKSINDTYGHEIGDQALVNLARVLQRSVRSTDLVCRYGGEEFAICMPAADAVMATNMAERLRRRVEDEVAARLSLAAGNRVTASIGVASSLNSRAPIVDLMAHADKALYRAKQQGRNRVQAAACCS